MSNKGQNYMIYYSLPNGGGLSKMQASHWLLSQFWTDFQSFGIYPDNNYSPVQKLDHMTCSKLLMTTPLYMPKRITLHSFRFILRIVLDVKCQYISSQNIC